MEAYKCDKCGRFYDHYSGVKVEKPAAPLLDKANSLVLYKRDGIKGDRSRMLDLCPECMAELLSWFGGGK